MAALSGNESRHDGIVVLTRRGDLHSMLVNHLAERFRIAAVVVETDRGSIRRKMLRRRLRKLGILRVLGQLLYVAFERAPRPGAKRHLDRLLAGQDLTPPDQRYRTVEVKRINDPPARDLLREIGPRVVVVAGTSLLRKKLLALSPCFLNLHCGITPRYRGVYGAYWAVFEGRHDEAGVTIHKVDTGVDTGAIVSRAAIDVEPTDSARSLVAKQYLRGAELMADAVGAATRGDLPSLESEGESKLWYHPTIWDERRFRVELRRAA